MLALANFLNILTIKFTVCLDIISEHQNQIAVYLEDPIYIQTMFALNMVKALIHMIISLS